jgi:lipopolysaccharide biosynthesis glycosyltransferase
MNILFSSDDNYARHLGVAIDSLLLHNIDVPKIRLFIIDNHISQLNIDKLESVVNSFKNSEIFFIPFESYVKKLSLNLAWPISLSSYARLFVGEMLPADVERVLYMDCDIVVKGSLLKLWNWDLGDNCLGAIQDTIPARTKASVGLSPTQPYFNAGVLLIDLKRWRQNKVGERCLAFIDSHAGRVSHHDQGVLNGVLMGQWARLPLKYNVMTVHYMMSQNKIRKFYKDDATFYDSYETEDAIKKPVILHFTPSFTVRPWEKNCSHPFRDDYKGLYLSLPWKDVPFSRSNDPWYVRLLNLRYRFFPI